MKSVIKSVILLVFSLCVLSTCQSCQKAPMNGKLDGMWQIMEISPNPGTEIFGQQKYWAFYMHVVDLAYFDGIFATGNMKFDGNTLVADFPYSGFPGNEDKYMEFGVNSNPVVYEVVVLTSGKLVLRNGNTIITMRKF